ncbi:TolB-like translocation protein [Thermogemmatispora tikiterensis]|uniref:Lipoprotein LpqB beta-propeller domain-containing protein n=1 Tax=Thermogemmatispora tikiterensis TaxID=1825093 RepID=A0A328V8N2_9CHLR|nr:hypothetical protein [Thermogemmatispora tikiterensis]RAQ93908.1 hypothetical protein A4R35_00085 [Thermogemmatispora tikiterensis]
MPVTQTSCPGISPTNPFGTRPAVMRPLALGSHQNLVYIYNEGQSQTSTAHGHLVRYDVTTGQRVTIITSGLLISEAQVSADGQWIMFLSLPDPQRDPNHAALLQMVRMDGQGLQTLYCFPKLPYTPKGGAFSAFEGRGIISYTGYPPVRFAWSPDERHVLLSADLQGTTSLMTLLDIRTGNLRQLLLYTQFCAIAIPLTWLNSSQAYIVTESRVTCGSPPLPMNLYLIDVNKSTNPANPVWNDVIEENVRFTEVAVDTSPDGSRLFVSTCERSGPAISTIVSEPAVGGSQTTIYRQLASAQNPESCVESIRAATTRTLLVLMSGAPYQATFQLAVLSSDGHGQPRVLANLEQGSSYSLDQAVPALWSLISRDGHLYAMTGSKPLAYGNNLIEETTVFYGSLSGGKPVAVATASNGTVDVVGWTAL